MSADTRTVHADESHTIGEVLDLHQIVDGRGNVTYKIGHVIEDAWNNVRRSNLGQGRVITCKQTDPYTWTLKVELIPDDAS